MLCYCWYFWSWLLEVYGSFSPLPTALKIASKMISFLVDKWIPKQEYKKATKAGSLSHTGWLTKRFRAFSHKAPTLWKYKRPLWAAVYNTQKSVQFLTVIYDIINLKKVHTKTLWKVLLLKDKPNCGLFIFTLCSIEWLAPGIWSVHI